MSLGASVVGWLVKGAVILLGSAVAAWWSRRRSAAVRHAIWTAGLFGVVALPLLMAVVPAIEVPVLTAVPESGLIAVIDRSTALTAFEVDATVPAAVSEASVESGPAPRAWVTGSGVGWTVARVAVGVWLIGLLAGLVWIIVGEVAARRVARLARPAGAAWAAGDELWRAAGIRRPLRVVEIDAEVVPFTFGWFGPVVVVPKAGATWPAQHRRDVLAHELAHVSRHDCLTHLVARLACAMHWPNPLVWVAARQARVEREHACDDAVLSGGVSASRYAEELLSTARAMRTSLGPVMAGLSMARPSELARRLGSVLDRGRARAALSGRSLGVTGAATLAVILPVAAVVPVAARSAGADAAMSSSVVSVDTLDDIVGAIQPRPPRRPRPPLPLRPSRPAPPPPLFSTRAPEPPVPVTAPEPPPAPMRTPPPPASGTSPEPPPAPILAPAGWSRLTGEARSVIGLRPGPFGRQAGTPCPVAKDGNRTVRLSSSMSITGQGTASDGKDTFVTWTGRDCSVVVHVVGQVKFTADERDVASLSSDGRFEITHVEGRAERKYQVRDRNGTVERRYTVDGDPAVEDAQFSEWRAAVVLAFIRRSGYDAEGRARRLLAARGPAGVFNEIDQIDSDWAASRYFRALIDGADLDATVGAEAVTRAGRRIDSDFELGRILAAIPGRLLGEERVREAFVGAAATMDSDFEMAKVLKGVLTSGRPSAAVVTAMLELSGQIESDFEKHRVLSAFLRGSPGRSALEAALAVAGSIESDFEVATWLKEALGSGAVTAEMAPAFFAAAAGIESDFELAGVLVLAAKRGLADGENRVAFRRAAGTIESSFERQRVMAALGERATEN